MITIAEMPAQKVKSITSNLEEILNAKIIEDLVTKNERTLKVH